MLHLKQQSPLCGQIRMSPLERDKEMELVTMSKKELHRLEVMKQMEEKRISQKTAAEELGIGVRQIKRLWRSYRE